MPLHFFQLNQCLFDSRLERFQVALVTGFVKKWDIEVTPFLVKKKFFLLSMGAFERQSKRRQKILTDVFFSIYQYDQRDK